MSFNSGFRRRQSVQLNTPIEEKLTVNADAERVSITSIVQRARRNGGIVGSVPVRNGYFDDISSAPTYMEAMNMVSRAQSMFEALPSKLRDRFGNDPKALLEFLDDPANKEEAIKLGLLAKPKDPEPPPPPMRVEVVNPTPDKV